MNTTILKRLSKECTPAYVLDVEKIKQRVSDTKAALHKEQEVALCYAMKANPFLVSALDALVERFEVCSPGEMAICMRKKIAPEKIVLSGVNKGYEDTLAAMQYGVKTFTAESWKHLNILERCAADTGRTVEVLIRLTSGNQFGVDRETVRTMVERRQQYSHLQIKGIHYYSGTQKKADKIADEVQMLVDFTDELRNDYQLELTHIEYGPGLSIDYFGGKEEAATILEKCAEALSVAKGKVQLTVELGRFLTADCGNYITKVVDVKGDAELTYCIVDGGIHHVNYYGQVMGVRIPPVRCYQLQQGEYVESAILDKNETEGINVCVCGSLCTTADVLIKNIRLKDIREEDVFLFEKIGAYSVTEGMYLFLSRKLPKIYLLENGQLQLIRDAHETYELNCGEEKETDK
ncbi:MAG: diaminopimelate decarboxylase [Lachnospiraceae bacterium]|nr:diaminopimelate decarboxylase [Lachnospiraceae bacterium]